MAEQVPFPDPQGHVGDDPSLRRRILGCLGCGGLGLASVLAAGILLIIGLGSFASGCDLEVGSPGEGTDSERLAVTVAPAAGLEDATTVRVTSTAFEPDTIVGIAVCLRAADTERRGVQACDEVQGARYATDPAGHLDATYPVPRVITVGGKAFDCAASPRRCLVVAADASDYDRSGGRAVTFRSGLPAADLRTVTVRPATDHLAIGSDPKLEGPVPAGTKLQVLATGFQPGEPVLLAYCSDDLATVSVAEACEPLDAGAAVSAVVLRSVEGEFVHADATGAVTAKFEARPSLTPIGDDLSGYPTDPSVASTTKPSSPTGTAATSTTRPATGAVDCREAPGRCTIVIAAAADTKRSAVLPYAVQP